MLKRWLKLKAASEYASIGQHRLKELALKKTIRGFQDPDSKRGDWIFDVKSLDEYRERQAGRFVSPHEKALAILKGIRV
jgi:hypothetical protein